MQLAVCGATSNFQLGLATDKVVHEPKIVKRASLRATLALTPLLAGLSVLMAATSDFHSVVVTPDRHTLVCGVDSHHIPSVAFLSMTFSHPWIRCRRRRRQSSRR